MKKVALTVIFFLLCSCSAMTGLATDAVLGSTTKGMDITAQVGKENNKGMVNAKMDLTEQVDIDDVQGNANIKSGNTTTNEPYTMIGLVLAGMFFPMLLVFYLIPTPRWLDKRHKEKMQV